MKNFFRHLWGPKPPPPRRPAEPPSTKEFRPTPPIRVLAGSTRLEVGVVTEVGTVREHNEDNYYVPGRPSVNSGHPGNGDGPVFAGPSDLFVVADGMGGQAAGEEASRMAVEYIPRELTRRLVGEQDDTAVARAVREAVARANEEILARSHLEPGLANMGTTVVLALFRNGLAYVAGIGDSRAYRVRDGRVEQLTRDHSLANALGEAGTIRPEEVENHKFKHVLYLYLGSKDARDGPEDVRAVDCRPGDHFVLASDGLTGVVDDATLAALIAEAADPQGAARSLVERALENRSKDNITCVVIRVCGPGPL